MRHHFFVRALLVSAAFGLAGAVEATPPLRLSGSMIASGAVRTTVDARAQITPNGQTVLFVADRVTNGIQELWSVPIAGGTPSRRSGTITSTGVDSFKISPDGNWVAYAADAGSGRLELYLAPTTGASTPVNLSVQPAGVTSGVQTYDFTPNSANVIFIADRVDDGIAKNELWTVPIVGGTPVKLSGTTIATGNIGSFRISPNGSTVVFRGDRIVNDRFELWSTPVAGGTITNLSGALSGTQSVVSQVISGDNARVVFAGDLDTANVIELYSVPLAGGTRTKLSGAIVPAGGDVLTYQLTPNNQTVVFRADRDVDGLFDVWAVPIAGGALVKLTNSVSGSTNALEFLITADGQRLVLMVSVANGVDIWSVPIAGGPMTQIMPDQSGTVSVSYVTLQLSPDGSRAVFAIDRVTSGVRELWSVPVTGGPIAKLSPPLASGASVTSMQISPDSKKVVFTLADQAPGDVDLWSVDVAGGVATRISGDVTHAAGATAAIAAISPDGANVVFTMDRVTDGVVELWSNRINGGGPALDIDGDGKVLANTDLLILTRWQLGVRGNALFAGALGAGATRNTAALLEAYLQQLDALAAP